LNRSLVANKVPQLTIELKAAARDCGNREAVEEVES
jgi:hypothetical protein